MVKDWSIFGERDGDGVVSVWRMVQRNDKQEVGVEGKSQPKILFGLGRCKIISQIVRN